MTVNGRQIDHQRAIDIDLQQNSRTVEAYDTLTRVLKDQYGVSSDGLMFGKDRMSSGLFFFAMSNHKDTHQHSKTVEPNNRGQCGLGIDWRPPGHDNRLVCLLISSFDVTTQITHSRQLIHNFNLQFF